MEGLRDEGENRCRESRPGRLPSENTPFRLCLVTIRSAAVTKEWFRQTSRRDPFAWPGDFPAYHRQWDENKPLELLVLG
jgi:hypothetical protein